VGQRLWRWLARRADALAIAVATGIHPAGRYFPLPPEQTPHLVFDGVGELLDIL